MVEADGHAAPMKLPLLVFLVSTLVPPASAKFAEAAMQLPADLAAAERMPVRGRQGWKRLERLEFGGYVVNDVERSLTKGGDLAIAIPGLGYEGSKRRQAFRFAVEGPGVRAWRGAAATNLRRRALDVGVDIELRNKSGFRALLSTDAAPDEVWTLELTEKGERPLTGTLRQGDRIVNVTGTNRLAGTRFPLGETSGYVFESKGRPVAAVEVVNNGAVWFAPDLDPVLRAPVTAAMSSLLLFEELRKTLPE